MKRLDLRLLRLIKNTKGQFIAIIVLVITGLTIYTAFSMAIVNLEDSVNHYYEVSNFSDIYIQLVKIPETALEKIKNIDGIEMVEGRIVFDVPLKVNDEDEKVKVRVVSVSNDNQISTLYKISGDKIQNESKDVLVIQQFANARGINSGDTITPQIESRLHSLNVQGIVASSEYVYIMEDEQSLLPQPDKFGVIYVSEAFAMQNFGFRDSFNEVLVKVKNYEDIDKIKSKLEKELDKYGVKRIYNREDQLSNRMINEEIEGVKQMSGVVPVIFLGAAAVIIAAMLSRMVKNDRMAIGVLKALGYSGLEVLMHYTKYSLLIGLIGSIFGVILGTLLSGSITRLYAQFFNIPMLTFRFYYGFFASATVLSVIFCSAAGIWGARNVIKIVPAESMRPEAPKAGGRIFLDRVEVIWNRVTFSWKMVLRNILRNKKRFIFITFGIAIAYAITLLPGAMMSASTSMFDAHYSEFMKMDYNINFSKPLNQKVVNNIESVINTKVVEPKIEFPFQIANGNKKKVANIIGVYHDTAFYNFTDTNENNIKLSKDGIFLTEGLAKYLGVGKGDKVKIETFLPNKEDVYIEVKAIVKQSLGINGYMNIDEMMRELTDANLITGVYIDSEDNVKGKLEDAKNISSIQSLQDMREIFEQFLGMMIASLGMMLIFGGILGFVIVYNSTVMSISERRLEFSSLRVMGFSKKEIFRMITKENTLMAIMGIIIGMPLGNSMITAMEETFNTDLYTMDITLSLNSYLLAIIATVIFVTLAQLATLKKIHKLDFIEALKNRVS